MQIFFWTPLIYLFKAMRMKVLDLRPGLFERTWGFFSFYYSLFCTWRCAIFKLRKVELDTQICLFCIAQIKNCAEYLWGKFVDCARQMNGSRSYACLTANRMIAMTILKCVNITFYPCLMILTWTFVMMHSLFCETNEILWK